VLRRTRLRRTGFLPRRTPLRAVNHERRAKVRAVTFGPQAELCRSLPCCVCGAPPPSDPHHVLPRGAGGVDSDCVAICRMHHSEWHAIGPVAFDAKYGTDLRAEASRLADRLMPSSSRLTG